jgi:hypothetical protein
MQNTDLDQGHVVGVRHGEHFVYDATLIDLVADAR